jgi:hypothetical protein
MGFKGGSRAGWKLVWAADWITIWIFGIVGVTVATTGGITRTRGVLTRADWAPKSEVKGRGNGEKEREHEKLKTA